MNGFPQWPSVHVQELPFMRSFLLFSLFSDEAPYTNLFSYTICFSTIYVKSRLFASIFEIILG